MCSVHLFGFLRRTPLSRSSLWNVDPEPETQTLLCLLQGSTAMLTSTHASRGVEAAARDGEAEAREEPFQEEGTRRGQRIAGSYHPPAMSEQE